ncbi:hypothetical protein TNIN_390471 [Trichonephila inaurata madagascariensis]|uniref:Uncharacterized protein n=1 Tax=Trichonephila inaurata madagascariensis TaxID=2747483 RepID=A0A8X6WMM8_9ARAC|nr:hypothetical protein TNIN_390471 [Trichonephila inaurata madagascariensis]
MIGPSFSTARKLQRKLCCRHKRLMTTEEGEKTCFHCVITTTTNKQKFVKEKGIQNGSKASSAKVFPSSLLILEEKSGNRKTEQELHNEKLIPLVVIQWKL